MKKLIPFAFIALAGCLEPPVPGFEFSETVQAVDDRLPGGVTFVQNIPFISVTRVNEEPLGPNDFDLAFAAVRQYCGSKGASFSGNGSDLALGLPTFRNGAWLIAGNCLGAAPVATLATQAAAE